MHYLDERKPYSSLSWTGKSTVGPRGGGDSPYMNRIADTYEDLNIVAVGADSGHIAGESCAHGFGSIETKPR